jgi:hypothetical protein
MTTTHFDGFKLRFQHRRRLGKSGHRCSLAKSPLPPHGIEGHRRLGVQWCWVGDLNIRRVLPLPETRSSTCVHTFTVCFYRAHGDLNIRRVLPGTCREQLIRRVPPIDKRRPTPSPCVEVTTHGKKGHVRSTRSPAVTDVRIGVGRYSSPCVKRGHTVTTIPIRRVSNEDTCQLYLSTLRFLVAHGEGAQKI